MGESGRDGPGADYGQMQPGAEGYEGESSLPWQNTGPQRSALGAMVQTVGRVLGQPSLAFSRVRVEGSLGGSLLYVLILGTIGGYVASAWQVALRNQAVGEFEPIEAVGGPAIYAALVVVATPLLVVLLSLLSAGLVHFCLWMVGGANESLEATYAVIAYAQGSTALFAIVPFCGGLIGAIWALVVEIVGLRQAHHTTSGRAAAGVLLPIVICCGAFVGVFVALGFAAALLGAGTM
jgi:hypothetical protein